jgi:hypothetical protein
MKILVKEWSSYKIINGVLFLLLAMMFVYVGLFYAPGQVNCVVKLKTGLECSSCGFTRDFYSILHCNFTGLINIYSLQVFLFFLLQLVVRGSLFIIAKDKLSLIYIDSFVSGVAFIYIFYPLTQHLF